MLGSDATMRDGRNGSRWLRPALAVILPRPALVGRTVDLVRGVRERVPVPAISHHESIESHTRNTSTDTSDEVPAGRKGTEQRTNTKTGTPRVQSRPEGPEPSVRRVPSGSGEEAPRRRGFLRDRSGGRSRIGSMESPGREEG